jgi:hypothetical protein
LRVAALIDVIATDRDLAARIVRGQDEALDRLEAKDFAGTLLRFVDRIRSAPPREHPEVAFDFWAQVTEAEEMDEIRPFRPAAFQALPKEAGTESGVGPPSLGDASGELRRGAAEGGGDARSGPALGDHAR